mmetsp:Transcript_35248/g.140061  ORF Transcript_35248/g.140061 Transcript_35248/m.140061 type:complete len:181 (-) Transcript_35248:4166-4708(-)
MPFQPSKKRLDGSVVKLDNLEEPERHVPDKEEAWKCLKEILSEETVTQLHRILVVNEIESLTLPTEGDKQRRKSIHDALKAFPVSTETSTNGDGSKVNNADRQEQSKRPGSASEEASRYLSCLLFSTSQLDTHSQSCWIGMIDGHRSDPLRPVKNSCSQARIRRLSSTRRTQIQTRPSVG